MVIGNCDTVYRPKPRAPKWLFIWNGIRRFHHHLRSSDTAIQQYNTAYCYICHYARKQPGHVICRVHLPFLYTLLSAHPAATAPGPIGFPFLDPIWSGLACELLRASLRESYWQWRSRCVFEPILFDCISDMSQTVLCQYSVHTDAFSWFCSVSVTAQSISLAFSSHLLVHEIFQPILLHLDSH